MRTRSAKLAEINRTARCYANRSRHNKPDCASRFRGECQSYVGLISLCGENHGISTDRVSDASKARRRGHRIEFEDLVVISIENFPEVELDAHGRSCHCCWVKVSLF